MVSRINGLEQYIINCNNNQVKRNLQHQMKWCCTRWSNTMPRGLGAKCGVITQRACLPIEGFGRKLSTEDPMGIRWRRWCNDASKRWRGRNKGVNGYVAKKVVPDDLIPTQKEWRFIWYYYYFSYHWSNGSLKLSCYSYTPFTRSFEVTGSLEEAHTHWRGHPNHHNALWSYSKALAQALRVLLLKWT